MQVAVLSVKRLNQKAQQPEHHSSSLVTGLKSPDYGSNDHSSMSFGFTDACACNRRARPTSNVIYWARTPHPKHI